jgi:hypothetical protein
VTALVVGVIVIVLLGLVVLVAWAPRRLTPEELHAQRAEGLELRLGRMSDVQLRELFGRVAWGTAEEQDMLARALEPPEDSFDAEY